MNPAVGDESPFTSILGSVYDAPAPAERIATEIAADGSCKVYKYSLPFCDPLCSGDEICAAGNMCQRRPSKVSVGDVSIEGVGPAPLKLSKVNNDYQYPLNAPYPGMTEGQPVTLTAAGDALPAFTLTAKGVVPLELASASFFIAKGQPLSISWTPGASSAGAEVSISLDISKHGGSPGYMHCTSPDSGAFTIAANVLQELVGLGVAGFPELLITRRTRAETTVTAGKIALEAKAVAKPALNVEGYCSCFDSSDCGSCSDKTKTSCDSVRKICNAP